MSCGIRRSSLSEYYSALGWQRKSASAEHGLPHRAEALDALPHGAAEDVEVVVAEPGRAAFGVAVRKQDVAEEYGSVRHAERRNGKRLIAPFVVYDDVELAASDGDFEHVDSVAPDAAVELLELAVFVVGDIHRLGVRHNTAHVVLDACLEKKQFHNFDLLRGFPVPLTVVLGSSDALIIPKPARKGGKQAILMAEIFAFSVII